MSNDSTKSFFHWLDVIKAIAGDESLPATAVAEILGTSTRNAYYVLKALGEYGFIVNHQYGGYNIDADSPFFQNYWCPLNRYNDLWNPFGLKKSRSKHYATSPSFNFVHFQEGLPKPSPMLPPNPFPGVPRIHERQYST